MSKRLAVLIGALTTAVSGGAIALVNLFVVPTVAKAIKKED